VTCSSRLLTKWLTSERWVTVSLRALAVNTVVGLVILFVANVVGLGIQIPFITLLV
jgi:hypothetical protein